MTIPKVKAYFSIQVYSGKQVFTAVPETLSDIIKELINLTFQAGIFPDSLKLVKIIPIFKNKGFSQDVNNYRHISLLSNIDNIFEKLGASRLNSDVWYQGHF